MPQISLYKLFGRFMGTPLDTSHKAIRKTINDINEIAQDNDLTTRFIHGAKPDDIGQSDAEKSRLNIISNDDKFGNKRIIEISLG